MSAADDYRAKTRDMIDQFIVAAENRTLEDCLPEKCEPVRKSLFSKVIAWVVHCVWRMSGEPLPHVVISRPLSPDSRLFTEVLCSKDVWPFVKSCLAKESIDAWLPREVGGNMFWQVVAGNDSIERLVLCCNRNSVRVAKRQLEVVIRPREEPVVGYGNWSIDRTNNDLPFRMTLKQVRSVVNGMQGG